MNLELNEGKGNSDATSAGLKKSGRQHHRREEALFQQHSVGFEALANVVEHTVNVAR